MLLLFFPLFVANVIAACLPVAQYPPWGRRCLLYLNLLAIFAFVVQSFRPPSYSEWGMGDGSPYFRMAAVLLFLSSLPVAWTSFHRGKRLCLPLVLPLLLSPANLWAQTNEPAVQPETLAAFMQQWQKFQPLESFPESPVDWPFLLAALAKDPHGPWASYIDIIAGDARARIRDVKWAERKAWAEALLSTLRKAEQLWKQFQTAGVVITNRPMAFVFEPGEYPRTTAFLSLEVGQNLAALKADAQRQLVQAADTNRWDYGEVVFHANELLGRIAIKEGNFAEARRCLRASAKSSGSIALGSFGPDFVLAHELLDHGDKEDRATVLAFLEDVRKWCGDPATKPEANSRRVADDKLKEIEAWKQEIAAGRIPEHRKWR